MTLPRSAAAALLVALLAGCPNGPAPSRPAGAGLMLRFNGGEAAAAKVGERRALTITSPPQGEQLIGALIGDESGSAVRWHADPADAVAFESSSWGATFRRPGAVKIWATSAGPDGVEVKSNELVLQVSQ